MDRCGRAQVRSSRQDSRSVVGIAVIKSENGFRWRGSSGCYNWLSSKIREAYKGQAGASTSTCAARAKQGSTVRLETTCIEQVTNK